MPAKDITIIRKGDADYPAMLLNMPGAPERLYCRGDISLLKSYGIAVVGARAATPYGIETAQNFARGLARAGWCIVSGMALGIDGAAHRATVDIGGRTVAVLGSGVDDDSIYPREHAMLAQDIIASGGLLCSEYEPGTPGYPSNFPARNRIVAALVRGVVIVEASIKSGALITAKLAADMGRDVFAVPGSIYSPRSEGTHMLLRNGAKLAACTQDILEEYSDFQETLPLSDVSTRDPLQAKVLAILKADGPQTTDALISRTGNEANDVTSVIALLELEGVVRIHGTTIRLS